MASLEEDKLAVFHYLGVSDIWLDKMGGFSWERSYQIGIIVLTIKVKNWCLN
jgi:hypothetical protein